MAADNSRGPWAYSSQASMFSEQKAMQIHGGDFTMVINPPPSNRKLLDILSLHVNPELFHDSKTHDRLLLEQNHILPSTFESEIQGIVANAATQTNALDGWTRVLRRNFSGQKNSRIVALETSRILESCGTLLASIMLPSSPLIGAPNGKDDRWGNATAYPIIASLVYQMVVNIPSTSRHVEDAINKDPMIFYRNTQAQVKTLIVEPWIAAAKEDLPERRQWASNVVVHGSSEQVSDRSACGQIFRAIESTAQDRNMALPLVLIFISSTPDSESDPKQPMTLAWFLAMYHKNSALYVKIGLYFA